MDLTGLPALDVAIGLSFIFFLLATLALTIQEFVASFLGLRARTLEQGLRSMLEDEDVGWTQVDKFYDHPLIRSLYRTAPPAVIKKPKNAAQTQSAPAGRNAGKESDHRLRRAGRALWRTKGPSYISPRSFALVLLDNVAPAEGETTEVDAVVPAEGEKTEVDAVARAEGEKTEVNAAEAAVAHLPDSVRERIKPLVEAAQGDVERLRVSLDAWYDDTMARVSGWYKRKTQIIILVIGLLLVPAINANAIAMAQRMWKDDSVRSAVVAQAQADAGAAPKRTLTTAADDVDKVAKVGIPLGWTGSAVPRSTTGIVTAVAGWILTIFAISLGAPFWFDTLSRFSRLRSSGKPETPLPAAASGKSNERILTPPQTPPAVVVGQPDVTGGG
jgi:hypothetical protein